MREHGVSLSDLAGCLVSHEHGDHSKGVVDLLHAGVDCYMSHGTGKSLEITEHHRSHTLYDGVTIEITPGNWRILPFALEHDAAEPLGFFIGRRDERLLFVADTGYVKERFAGITVAAIECNFQAEILSNNILSGALPSVIGRRVRRSHFSLENVVSMLKENDLSRCREIWCLHLSNGNSDEAAMRSEIQKLTGIPTRIA
jgi:phosphoribosyl 1,2-cyclic phosphodiesterase